MSAQRSVLLGVLHPVRSIAWVCTITVARAIRKAKVHLVVVVVVVVVILPRLLRLC